MPDRAVSGDAQPSRSDPTILWPYATLEIVTALRNLPPLGPGDDTTIACPVCGDTAFLSADRRIVYCVFTCHRGMPGPASTDLLDHLVTRQRRRGRTIRRWPTSR